MGVTGLWQLLEPAARPCTIESLQGKIIAVDVSLWLHQAIKGSRQENNEHAFLITLLTRVCKLRYYGIKAVFVFDGDPPYLKRQVLREREYKRQTIGLKLDHKHQNLLDNKMKRHALSAVFGDDKIQSATQSQLSGTSVNPPTKSSTNLFALPANDFLDNQQSSDEEVETEDASFELLNHPDFQSLFDIDVHSKQFQALPVSTRHQLLLNLKEQMIFTHTSVDVTNGNDFSKYQLKRLRQKHLITKEIKKIEQIIMQENNKNVILPSELEEYNSDEIIIRRVEGEKNTDYVYISDTSKLNKKKDLHKSMTCEVNALAGGFLLEESDEESPTSANPEIPSSQDTELPSTSCNFVGSGGFFADHASHSPPPPLIQSSSSLEAINEVSEDFPLDNKTSATTTRTTYSSLDHSSTTSGTSQAAVGGTIAGVPRGNVVHLSSDDSSEDGVVEKQGGDRSAFTAKQEFTANLKHFSRNLSSDYSSSSSQSDSEIPEKMLKLAENYENKRVPCLNESSESDSDDDFIEVSNIIDQPYSKTQISMANKDHTSSTPGGEITSSLQGQITSSPQGETSSTTQGKITSRQGLISSNPQDESTTSTLQFQATSTCQSNTMPFPDGPLSQEKAGLKNVKSPKTLLDEPANQNYGSTKAIGKTNMTVNVGDVIEDEAEIKVESPLEGKQVCSEKVIQRENGDQVDLNEIREEELLSTSDKVKEETCEIISKNKESGNNHDDEANKVNDNVNEFTSSVKEHGMDSVKELLKLNEAKLSDEIDCSERSLRTVTQVQYQQAKQLLDIFKVPYIQSPGEAEAQCAYLELNDLCAGSITDDGDIWCFGGRTIYKHFFSKTKELKLYKYYDVVNNLLLDREACICVALLCGSDYTHGVEGIGPVGAREILAEFSGGSDGGLPLQALHQFKKWMKSPKQKDENSIKSRLRKMKCNISEGFPSERVIDAYQDPNVEHIESLDFDWSKKVHIEEIREYTAELFNWSKQKCDEIVLPMIKKLNEPIKQKVISSYLVKDKLPVKKTSKRVQKAIANQKKKNLLPVIKQNPRKCKAKITKNKKKAPIEGGFTRIVQELACLSDNSSSSSS